MPNGVESLTGPIIAKINFETPYTTLVGRRYPLKQVGLHSLHKAKIDSFQSTRLANAFCKKIIKFLYGLKRYEPTPSLHLKRYVICR